MLIGQVGDKSWGITCPSGRDPGHRGSSDVNSFPKPLMYYNTVISTVLIKYEFILFSEQTKWQNVINESRKHKRSCVGPSEYFPLYE